MSTIAKQDAEAQPAFMTSLFQANFYKPTQGRMARQVVFAALATLLVLLCWEISFFSFFMSRLGYAGCWILFGSLGLISLWVSFRLIHHPPIAGFLISVEAEMNKVSWPGWPMLWRATGVVIFVILALSALLYLFDLAWTIVFNSLGIRK